jgi:hypothetical protein
MISLEHVVDPPAHCLAHLGTEASADSATRRVTRQKLPPERLRLDALRRRVPYKLTVRRTVLLVQKDFSGIQNPPRV